MFDVGDVVQLDCVVLVWVLGVFEFYDVVEVFVVVVVLEYLYCGCYCYYVFLWCCVVVVYVYVGVDCQFGDLVFQVCDVGWLCEYFGGGMIYDVIFGWIGSRLVV